jgi:hypothetical protein
VRSRRNDGSAEGDAVKSAVLASPERLAQVFENVIDNAVSFAPDGTGVDVRIVRRAAAWIVSIEDRSWNPGLTPRAGFQAVLQLSADGTARRTRWAQPPDRQADRRERRRLYGGSKAVTLGNSGRRRSSSSIALNHGCSTVSALASVMPGLSRPSTCIQRARRFRRPSNPGIACADIVVPRTWGGRGPSDRTRSPLTNEASRTTAPPPI